jgi:hypothetical protein
MKKATTYIIFAFVIVLAVYVYINSHKTIKEAFAKYKSYAQKYTEESKIRNKYYNVSKPANTWKSNNKYIHDMIKDYQQYM